MFKNPFSFDGRIRRTEYGISVIGIIFCQLILSYLMSLELSLVAIGFIPLIWFTLAQGSKRCHDMGQSGWYQLIPLYFIWMIFAEGNPSTNSYGSNPKE